MIDGDTDCQPQHLKAPGLGTNVRGWDKLNEFLSYQYLNHYKLSIHIIALYVVNADGDLFAVKDVEDIHPADDQPI